ncbi:unnamed protein product [Mycetohabitans rhizoxinica HKI 454]|uniref:Uncharacterized protein n=1 Tax=Mycetohabitans rhizoxinica (strain DSM 19002 / CIP 109453 / HKI 454) TaxID=882378 RepID=E5ALI8_MYCRK|nr:unnamed protein product [Mycetohabitans rhizoxinica HKI 454]
MYCLPPVFMTAYIVEPHLKSGPDPDPFICFEHAFRALRAFLRTTHRNA